MCVNYVHSQRTFRLILYNSQLLDIPYIGEEASMLIVLPQEIEGLNDIMVKLATGHDLFADVEKMYKTTVRVTIPKFKIETTIDLKKLLPKVRSVYHIMVGICSKNTQNYYVFSAWHFCNFQIYKFGYY